ncbi:MAG: hypothetical protein GEV11_00435 [Streptosporangiales bacterium]|nr:hypothetical protein [Streptosporangiales bacterium]
MKGPLGSEHDAVIFDCDGVLADSDDAWERAEAGLAAAYGLPFDAAIRAATHGLTPRDSVRLLTAGRPELPARSPRAARWWAWSAPAARRCTAPGAASRTWRPSRPDPAPASRAPTRHARCWVSAGARRVPKTPLTSL